MIIMNLVCEKEHNWIPDYGIRDVLLAHGKVNKKGRCGQHFTTQHILL